MPGLLETAGARPQKEPKGAPIFISSTFTGLYTQRNVLHDPSDIATARYYGGRPDALWMGSNIELTNRLTLQRRPGLIPFSTATYPTPPDRAFNFQLLNGTIQVIVDTSYSGTLFITSVANSSGGTAVYTGTFPGGASNGFANWIFTITDFVNPSNNGFFTCQSSTATTLTLENPNAIAETPSPFAAQGGTFGAVYIDNQDGTKTFLFAKSPQAGQTYFVAVAGVLYMGDGEDIRMYTPGNPNGTIWDWGIAAPTAPPNVTIIESASATAKWQAHTVFSTMGLLNDGTNIQQLISVNATGTNTTQFGETGNGDPAWNLTPGSTTTEASGTPITWTNYGPVVPWSANKTFDNFSLGGTLTDPCFCYDPTTGAIFGNTNPSNLAGKTGPNKPAFHSNPGAGTYDPAGGGHPPGVAWYALSTVSGWKANTAYAQWATGTDGGGNAVLVPPILPPPTNQIIYIMTASNAGTSGTGGTAPIWSTIPGTPTIDNQLIWVCLGSNTRTTLTGYSAWTSPTSQTFSVIIDSNGNYQVCTIGGISSSTATASLPWSGVYGGQTPDGSVTWTCVGHVVTWSANTIWNLPTSGFSPPQQSQPYGGSAIVDPGGIVEYVINSGKSAATIPTFNGLGKTTTDGTSPTITWYGVAVANTNSLSWTKGYVYAYSYESRLASDPYNTTAPPGYPNGPLGPPTGSETGDISTASPVYTITGANSGAVNTISGIGSTNPAVDTIIIWRSADGGGPDNMFFLTEIPNPPPIGGIAQPWSFQDFLPDVATNLYPGLDELEPAPIDDENDPPPNNFLPMVYNFQRIWGASGSTVFFSGGPDVITGNPNSAFNPADDFPYLAPVIRLVKSSQGIIVFLTDSIELIGGGPATASFASITLAQGMGLLSYNALDVFAGEIYFFRSDNNFCVMTPSLNVSTAGFPLGDQFANLPSSGVSDTTWNPANVYVAVHQNGIDNCIFVGDGSTGWYRCNPHQVPGGAQGPEPVWSPYATITGGCKMVQSVETTPGIKQLLVGAPAFTANSEIMSRSLTAFTDNGTQYDAYFVMGAIMLAHPGQIAALDFMEFDFSGPGFFPTVSYLLNEVSGTFVPFIQKPVYDPPSLYGNTTAPLSYNPNRYYFLGNGSLARARFMQLRIDFGTNASANEIYNATIFGRIMVEG